MPLTTGTGLSMQDFFDPPTPPTMASQTHVPNSHRKYDLEADGITITGHTPPKRQGADARDVVNWSRNGGKSKDHPFVIDDDEEVQEIYETSSIGLSQQGTSWRSVTNPDMTVGTTLAFLYMTYLRCHCRIQLSALRNSKPRIQIFKYRATPVKALQYLLVHATAIQNMYHISPLEAQGLCHRLCPSTQAKLAQFRMDPFLAIQTTPQTFPARGKIQNNQF